MTAIGIDNNGVLNRPYGKEDIDLDENNSYIFNGARSTFFMRIRNLMHGGLTRVYNAVSDAWRAEGLINEFDAWQAEFYKNSLFSLVVAFKTVTEKIIVNKLNVEDYPSENEYLISILGNSGITVDGKSK